MAYARSYGSLPAFVCRRNAGKSASSRLSSVFAAFVTGELVPERLLSCDRARFAANELPTLPSGEGIVFGNLVMSEKTSWHFGILKP